MKPIDISARASSLAEAMMCPLRWAVKYLDYEPTGPQPPMGPAAAIGSAVHRSTGTYDAIVLNGGKPDVAETAQVAYDYLQNPDDEINWEGNSKKKIEERTMSVHANYCFDITQQMDDNGVKYTNVETQLPDTPVDFSKAEDDPLPVRITLTGTLDRVHKVGDDYGITEIKTGARVCSTPSGKFKGQLGAYEFLAEKHFGQRMKADGNLVRLQTTVTPKTDVVPVRGSRHAMAGILRTLAIYTQHGHFPGDPSTFLCGPKWCSHYSYCKYR